MIDWLFFKTRVAPKSCYGYNIRLILGAYERKHRWPVTDIVAKGLVQWPSNIRDWRLVQWLTSRNPDFQIFNTRHGYGTSVTVRDFSHFMRLYPWLVTGIFFQMFRITRRIIASRNRTGWSFMNNDGLLYRFILVTWAVFYIWSVFFSVSVLIIIFFFVNWRFNDYTVNCLCKIKFHTINFSA